MGPRSGPPVLVWMQPGRRYLKTSLDDATGSWLGCKDGSPGCDVELGLPSLDSSPAPPTLSARAGEDGSHGASALVSSVVPELGWY